MTAALDTNDLSDENEKELNFIPLGFGLVHWVILNVPVRDVIYMVLFLFSIYFPYSTKIQKILLLLSSFSAFVTILLIIDQYTKEKYNKILEKIDILEFVDKRPFKESSLTVRRKSFGAYVAQSVFKNYF